MIRPATLAKLRRATELALGCPPQEIDRAEAHELLETLDLVEPFLKAYDDASTADAEGITWNVDPAAMRALWQAVDDAADNLRKALR